MENCFQNPDHVADRHPIVAVVAYDEAFAPDAISISKDGKWMSMPICSECHAAPKLKAHFFVRQAAQTAVDRAGSTNLRG